MELRANTAVDVLIGPFVDKTNGNTTEDALTLTQAEIKLSKNGQALTQKSDATSAAFDDDGYYNCELDATDTNTEGNLVLIVHQSANALPVRHEFDVLSEAAWLSKYEAKDTGYLKVHPDTIADAVLQEAIADHKATAGSLAEFVNYQQAVMGYWKTISDTGDGTILVYDSDGSTLLRTITFTTVTDARTGTGT